MDTACWHLAFKSQKKGLIKSAQRWGLNSRSQMCKAKILSTIPYISTVHHSAWQSEPKPTTNHTNVQSPDLCNGLEIHSKLLDVLGGFYTAPPLFFSSLLHRSAYVHESSMRHTLGFASSLRLALFDCRSVFSRA